jgi:hypothetical protein
MLRIPKSVPNSADRRSLLLPHAEALVRFGDHLNVSDDLLAESEHPDVVVIATPVQLYRSSSAEPVDRPTVTLWN